MKLTILGSGGSIANPTRMSTGFLLETSKSSWVIDFGGGSFYRLYNDLNYDYVSKVDGVFISHPHVDHLVDLMWFMHSLYNSTVYADWRKRPQDNRTKPLYLHGYPRFNEDYEKLRLMFPERKEKYEVLVDEHDEDTFQAEDLKVTTKIVPHVPEHFTAIGFRIEAEGKTLMYSGDSAYSEALVKLAKDADLALMESSVFPTLYKERGPGRTHISPFEAGKIAKEASVKRLVLTHLYDFDPEEEFINEAKKSYSGEVIVARDLLSIEV